MRQTITPCYILGVGIGVGVDWDVHIHIRFMVVLYVHAVNWLQSNTE